MWCLRCGVGWGLDFSAPCWYCHRSDAAMTVSKRDMISLPGRMRAFREIEREERLSVYFKKTLSRPEAESMRGTS